MKYRLYFSQWPFAEVLTGYVWMKLVVPNKVIVNSTLTCLMSPCVLVVVASSMDAYDVKVDYIGQNKFDVMGSVTFCLLGCPNSYQSTRG